MKTIDIIRTFTPETPGYNDTFAIIENGIELLTGHLSTEPNPYQPGTLKPWIDVYARIAEGLYAWQLIPNHAKYGRCILINGGGDVPTLNPNPNHNRAYVASEIFIHRGDTNTWRGSRGCMTVPPNIADKFFQMFDDNEKGKLIIRKASGQELRSI
jgi:hypothetical protein